MISTVLIINNIVNTALTIFATHVAVKSLEGLVSAEVATTIGGIITVVFLIVFSEILPKTIGASSPASISRLVAWPMLFSVKLFAPGTWLVSGLQSMALTLITSGDDESSVTSSDIKTMARVATQSEVVGNIGGHAMSQSVHLHETRVSEVMTPRVDILGLSIKMTYPEVVNAIRRTRNTRYPVYKDDLDDILGVIHLRDLFGMTPNQIENFTLETILRPPLFVPEQKRIDELITEMRVRRQHMAIAVDEYGGTAGLITLEDLLEELIGQIQDEHDRELPEVHRTVDGVILKATCKIADLEAVLHVELSDVDDIDTLAGLFLREFGKVPAEGDTITYMGVSLTVHRMKGPRVTRLIARRLLP